MSELTGVIHTISDTQEVSPSFSKREFVLKEQSSPQYEQYIPLEFTQDKCSLLDNYKAGQTVKVNFNYRGRLWTNREGIEKCFLTLQAWRIEAMEGNQPVAQTASVDQGDEQDDLPF